MDNTEERATAAEAEPPSPAGLGQETPEGRQAVKPGRWSYPPLRRPPQHGGGGAWRLQGARCGPLSQDEDAVASILEKEKQRPVTGKSLKSH